MVFLPSLFIFANEALANKLNLSTVLLKQGYQEMPIRLVQNGKSAVSFSPFVECIFTDNGKGLFSLDTGATDTVVDEKISLTNQFKPYVLARKKLSTGADGVLHEPKSVVIPVMKFSNFSAVNTVALVQDLTFMEAEFSQPVVGLIGMDFLRRYHAIMDVSAQRLYFLAKDKNLTQRNNDYQHRLSAAGYQKISLESAPSGHVTIIGKVNNQPIRFLLDTGVPKTILSADYAKKLGLKVSSNEQVGKGGGGGNVNFSYVKGNKISIASLAGSPQEIMVMDLKNVKIGMPIEGILGYDWLLAHRAVVDINGNMICQALVRSEVIFMERLSERS